MSQKPNQDAKNIGARFRSARSLVPDLNRKLFCERHGINRYTMQSWENGLHVSKGKNVEKFIEALAREGVFCTSEWLIEGIGEPARPLLGVNSVNLEPSEQGFYPGDTIDSIISLLQDSLNDNAEPLFRFSVPDDAMAPKFLAGDIVLARPVDKEEAASFQQKFCIIELGPDRHVVRKVVALKEGFLLLALDERLPSFTLNLDTKLYLVTWHFVSQ